MNNRYGFFTKLAERFPQSNKKYYFYFLWKNHLNNSGENDFTNMTENEFKNKFLKKKKATDEASEVSYKRLQMWETSDEYQELMQELYEFKMNQDFYNLYEIYLEKAKNGDAQAVNSLKTIKKEIESLNKNKKISNKSNDDEEEQFDLK